jgi:hypothetical protein
MALRTWGLSAAPAGRSGTRSRCSWEPCRICRCASGARGCAVHWGPY